MSIAAGSTAIASNSESPSDSGSGLVTSAVLSMWSWSTGFEGGIAAERTVRLARRAARLAGMLPRCIVVRGARVRIAYHRRRVSIDLVIQRVAGVIGRTAGAVAEQLAPGLAAIGRRWPRAPGPSAAF